MPELVQVNIGQQFADYVRRLHARLLNQGADHLTKYLMREGDRLVLLETEPPLPALPPRHPPVVKAEEPEPVPPAELPGGQVKPRPEGAKTKPAPAGKTNHKTNHKSKKASK